MARRSFGRRKSRDLGPLQVVVEGNLERAISRLKRMMASEGVLKDLKKRRYYEKPSVKRKRKQRDAERRRRRQLRREMRNQQ
jgi:small subunit ribosomal protein S21